MEQLKYAKTKVQIEQQRVGEARKAERIAAGLSLRKHAAALGISKTHLWAMERGIRRWKDPQ